MKILLRVAPALLITQFLLTNGNVCQTSKDFNTQSVPDCNCKVESVDHAVSHFISPMLTNLTTKAFLRYFYVDLDKPCPFYHEDAACMMEGCSVCACAEEEIPATWLSTSGKEEHHKKGSKEVHDGGYGWISSSADKYGFDYSSEHNKLADSTLGKVNLNIRDATTGSSGIVDVQHLKDTEDCDTDDWTSLSEALEHGSTSSSAVTQSGVYVNLLNNPEGYTGYGGPSARKVWRSITEENCFGELDDVCLEKRVFYRLMSGMQASISTHIAKKYHYKDDPADLFASSSGGKWGVNLPLYYNAVGNHPDRLDNMYFAFLFVLRAVVRAGDCLSNYPYSTGNATEDAMVSEIVKKLVHSKELSAVAAAGVDGLSLQGTGVEGGHYAAIDAVEECKYGFDESELFQVSGVSSDSQLYWSSLQEKRYLRDQFKHKFRNISTIMDCVTCEKCRLWGKVQILGFGTAIKVLLTPEEELVESCAVKVETVTAADGSTESSVSPSPYTKKLLNRQEIIGLLNTLNQLSKSIEFVANIKLQTNMMQEVTTRTAVKTDSSERMTEVTITEAVAKETTTFPVTTTTASPSGEDSVVEKTEVVVQDTIQLSVSSEVTQTDGANGGDESAVEETVTVTSESSVEDVVDTEQSRQPAQPEETMKTKKPNTHSEGYRKTLFTIFIVFALFGVGLLLFSTFESLKRQKVN